MSDTAFNLYVISFTAGKEAGLAMVAATDDRSAFQILKNGGSRHGEGYSLVQCRNIGMSTSCTFGILLESFVNAREAYDAIVQVVDRIARGEKGEKGDRGDVGPMLFDSVNVTVDDFAGDPEVTFGVVGKVLNMHFTGLRGRTGISIADISQTLVSNRDGGTNEITIRLDDGRTSKVYVKNGDTGVKNVNAFVDSLPGNPRVVTNLDNGLLSFSFFGLKGAQGNPGINNTVMSIVDSLPARASADTADIIYLIYNPSTGKYDRYITQFDGEDYSFAGAGSLSVDLGDYVRKDSEVWLTQEEFDAIPVKDITKTYNIYEEVEDIEEGSFDGGSGSGSGDSGEGSGSGSEGNSSDYGSSGSSASEGGPEDTA